MLKMKSKRIWAILLTLIILAVYSSANLSVVKAEDPDTKPLFTMSQLRLNGSSGTINVEQGETIDMYMLVKLTSPSTPPVDDVAGKFTFYLCSTWDRENVANRTVLATYEAVEPREWSSLSDTEKNLYYSNGIVDGNVVAIQHATLDTSSYAPGTTLYLTVEYEAADSSKYGSKHSKFCRQINITGTSNNPPTITNVTPENKITNTGIQVTFNVDDAETPKNDLTVEVYAGSDKSDPSKKITSENIDGNCNFTATENGVYTLVVTDKDGNSTETRVNINTIDKVPPTVNPEPDNTAPSKDPVTVTINPDDTASEGAAYDTPGVDRIEVTDSSNTPIPVTDQKFTVDKNGTYTITVTDKAGNITTVTIDITNISDESVPEESPTESPSTEAPSTAEPSTEASDEDHEEEDEPETTAAFVPDNTDKSNPATGDTTPIVFLTVILIATIVTLGCTVINKVTDKENE